MDASTLALFVGAGLLLNLTPGPDVLNVVTSALRGGFRAGAVAALGVAGGCFVHIGAAALGVGALLAASAEAFALLKWAGAAYLLWCGWRLLRSGPAGAMEIDAAGPVDSRASAMLDVFRRAFVTNALNPKVALFFLAFVPQFIAPGVDDKTLAFVALGLLFNLNGLAVNLGWALAAAALAARVQAARRVLTWIERGAGLLFVGFGLRLALSDPPAAAR
jgi:threonine/homoserine/homoserine lactone efflux protein